MANRRNPYFKFYPADFMGGIRGMSAQEVGVYTMLLCRMYEEDGPIQDDAFKLSAYCGMRQIAFVAALEKLVRLGKILRVDGSLFNDRARREISNRADGLEVAIRAGKASAEKRQQKQDHKPASVERNVNHTDTDTEVDIGKPISPAGKPPAKMRLPEGWLLSEEGWAYARSQAIPDGVIEDEARGFHAYWTDRRDRDASKSQRGWEQCWANRCRSIAGRYKGSGMAGKASPGGYGQGSSIAGIAAWRRATGQV